MRPANQRCELIDDIVRLLPNLGLGDLLDIALVAALLYVLLVALRRTRTTFLIPGIGLLAALYVLALALDLRLTGYLFRLLFAVILVGLIVLFHEEIRVWIERVLSALGAFEEKAYAVSAGRAWGRAVQEWPEEAYAWLGVGKLVLEEATQ